MNRLVSSVFLALLVCAHRPTVAGAEAAAGTTDLLWRKAVALVGANDAWNPGKIVLTGQELDGRGGTRSSWEVWTASTAGPDGLPAQEILRYVENGKDVTEQRRRAQQQSQGSGGSRGGGRGGFDWNPMDARETPFHPTQQPTVTIARLSSQVVLDGRTCVLYQFEQKVTDRAVATGKTWLDARTGAPVRLEGTLKPLPPLVQRLDMEVTYATTEQDWMVRRFHVRADATLLLIRRSYTMDMEMTEHWSADPGSGDPGSGDRGASAGPAR